MKKFEAHKALLEELQKKNAETQKTTEAFKAKFEANKDLLEKLQKKNAEFSHTFGQSDNQRINRQPSIETDNTETDELAESQSSGENTANFDNDPSTQEPEVGCLHNRIL